MTSPKSNPDTVNRRAFPSSHELEEILAAGALGAIRENQRLGLPFIAERDGKICYEDPFEAEAELLRRFPALAEKAVPRRDQFRIK